MESEVDYFVLLQASQAALKNAREYAEQADLLDARGWHGRAMALAILGQEEVGKAFLLGYTVVGVFQAHPKFLDAIERKHWPKQLLSCTVEVMSDFAERAASDPDFQALSHALDCMSSQDAEPLDEDQARAILGSLVDEMKPALMLMASRLLPFLQGLPAQFDAIQHGAVDREKQRGLYVDVDIANGRVATPADVGADDSQRQRDRLSTLLAHVPEAIPRVESPQQLNLMRQVLVPTLARMRRTPAKESIDARD